MSWFSDFEAFEPVVGTRKTYALGYPLQWEIGTKGSSWWLTVPTGTRFDISVPRLLEWLLSPHDRRVLLAAAIHDRLLERGHDAAFASAEFRRAAIARGVPKASAWGVFFATLIWTAFKRRPAML